MTDALLYLSGERVRVTGVYEIFHSGHRASHEAFLWENDSFPTCQRCGTNVIFRLVNPAKEPIREPVSADRDFTGRN